MLRSLLVAITATICIAVTACSDSQWVLRESQARSWCADQRTAIYPDKRNYDRTMQNHAQRIPLKTDYVTSFNHRSDDYQYKGDYDRAIQDYDQAVRLKPDDAAALNNRCWARAV